MPPGNGSSAPSPSGTPHHFPIEPLGYMLVGWSGVGVNGLLVLVVLWRLVVHHRSGPTPCSCSTKRFFHWLILLGRLSALPMFIGIITVGEFNLLQYSVHTLNNVFQSGALAVVVKEWAFVIAVLRHHSLLPTGSNEGQGGGVGDGRGGSLGPGDPGKRGVSDSASGSTTARRFDGNVNYSVRQGRYHTSCVKSVAIVYASVFAVLCLGSFLACAASYSLVSTAATGIFFSSSTHAVFISVQTFLEAIINTVFLAYGVSLRRSLIDNSPPRSQERVRKTLRRINVVVVVMAACSFLRLGLHVRSLFSSKQDPQWISVLTYYWLYEWVGRGLPALILLVLMRNPDTGGDAAFGRGAGGGGGGRRNRYGGPRGQGVGRGGSRQGGGTGGRGHRRGGGDIGDASPRSPESGRWSTRSGTPLWSSTDEGAFSDWPSSYGSGGGASNPASPQEQNLTRGVSPPRMLPEEHLAQQQYLQAQQEYHQQHVGDRYQMMG